MSARPKTGKKQSSMRNGRTTVSGPAAPDCSGTGDVVGEDAPSLPGGETDPGLILSAPDAKAAADDFVAAIAKHRHFVRETDPPRV